MKKDKYNVLNINKIKQNPPIYTVNIERSEQISLLCKFLRKQKDRKLEIIINGRRVKFDSLSGMKRFASGFECSFKILEQEAKAFHKDFINQISKLKNELATVKKEMYKQTDTHAVKSATMDIRQAAWKDHILELEDDRAILREELSRLMKPKVVKKRKPRKKTVRKKAKKK